MNRKVPVCRCPDQAAFAKSRDFDRWSALAAELARPDVELTADEFAAVWRVYVVEKRRGRVFDPMLVALLLVLSRQVLQLDAGVDDFTPLPERTYRPTEVNLAGKPFPSALARAGVSLIVTRADARAVAARKAVA